MTARPLVVYATPATGTQRAAFTYAEVAEMLGLSVWQARHLVRSGRLTAIEVGDRAKRIPAWSLQQLLADPASAPPQEITA